MPSFWQNEVHAYERWARAFGERAPRLLAVRSIEPLALVTSELPGRIVEGLSLAPDQQRAVWRAAGAALVGLHELEVGDGFGPSERDGSCAEDAPPRDAQTYVGDSLRHAVARADRGGYVSASELATVEAALALVPAFEGEPAVPCHRDYCAANWLVSAAGIWSGVIDFEFAHWDVRVTDFARDPDWTWLVRPDLTDAFREGYGRALTPAEEQQLLVRRAHYALEAVLWGRDNAYYGFEREGHDALAHLASLLRAS
jgi:aminoglycoside phosphotransferase